MLFAISNWFHTSFLRPTICYGSTRMGGLVEELIDLQFINVFKMMIFSFWQAWLEQLEPWLIKQGNLYR